MIDRAAILEALETRSYSQVARQFRVSRNVVAGLAHRAKIRRPAPPGAPAWGADRKPRAHPSPVSPVVDAIIDLLADGRPRTTSEIAERINARPGTVLHHLRVLVLAGAAVRLSYGCAGLPSIWQEAPE